MVQLRVDVEAANARREFERAAESVENLADELDDAEEQAQDLRTAFNMAGSEADRLQRQVQATDQRLEELRSTARSMGRLMPPHLREELRNTERASRELHRELDRTEAGARQLGQAMNAADDNVARLGDELDDAAEQARELERAMNDLDADAGRGIRRVQRQAAGWRDAGRDAARSFGGGFSALPIEVKAAAGIAAAGVAAMLGGAIGGAIAAGVGGGVMAVAIKQAMAESEVAQQAMIDNFAPMKKAIKEMALGYEDELVGAAITFGNTWDRISDEVGDAFAAMEKHVQPLADGLSELSVNAFGGDGFADLIESAGPVLDELARSLPMVGTALNDMFESIADGEGNVKGMRALMMVFAGTLRFAGEAIEFLSDGFDLATDAAEKFFTIASKIPVVGGMFEGAAQKWSEFNNPVQGSAKYMDAAGEAADGAATGVYRAGEAAEKAAKAAHKLNDELNEFIDQALAASGSAIAYERAIDELAESFKENGRSIDISNEKGRQNVEAINAVVEAAKRKMQSDIEAAGGEKATKAAVDAATGAYRAKIGQLEAQLRALGLTKAQVDALLGSYRDLAGAPNIYKTITYRVSASGPAALVNQAQQSGTYGGLGGRAAGGPITAGTPYIVGEEGPELIVPKSNGMVYTAAQTAAMMGAGGRPAAGAGGGAPSLQLVSSGGHNDWFGQALAYQIRTGGLRLVVVSGEVRVG